MSAARGNLPPDRDEQAALWCLSLAEGELPADEREAFDAWIIHPDNARAFEEAARVWNGSDGAAELPELIHMRSAALESFRRANQQRWTKRVPTRWYWASGIAAMFLIAIISAAMLYAPTQVFETGVGERRIAMLDDGSKLSLDAATEVEVRFSHGRRDLVLAHGRAKFDVAKDPLRPFSVTAGDKMVVATGTSFSVEVLNRQVRVLLYEGHVAVLDKAANKPVVQRPPRETKAGAETELAPGRELVAPLETMAPATVMPADPVRSLSWESGQLSFDDEPLQTAVIRMNRYSQEKLEVGDARAANVRVNGVFTAGDNAAFVEGVTALSGLRATRQPGKVTLRSN